MALNTADILIIVATIPLTMVFAAMLFHWRSALPVDVANDRSLHVGVVPRIGGLAMIAGITCALWILDEVGTVLDPEFVLTLITAGLLALVSYLDDRHGLPVAVRLVAHVAAATLLIELLQVQLPIALPLALVAVWATNLFNFMDGADGLAGGMATIGFSAMGLASANVAPDLGIVCFVLAAAAAGFLTFNFPPAKIFMGDAGSVPMGFLTAALGLVGWTRNAWPLSFIPLVFFPFVADSTVTLVKRFIAGREVWHPHREHFYQRLVGLGCSHRKLVGLYYMMMITCGGAALLSLTLSDVGKGIIWGGCCLITGFAMHRMDTRWKSFESGV